MEEKNNITIKVLEEQAAFDKTVKTTGSVHVRKTVKEEIAPVDGTLSSTSYTVERIPKDEAVAMAPEPVRYDGDRMIISVVEERLVVEKRLFLVEEIHLVRKKESKDFHDEVVLKKEVVDVERKPASE